LKDPIRYRFAKKIFKNVASFRRAISLSFAATLSPAKHHDFALIHHVVRTFKSQKPLQKRSFTTLGKNYRM
jgi:hypothetical protein